MIQIWSHWEPPCEPEDETNAVGGRAERQRETIGVLDIAMPAVSPGFFSYVINCLFYLNQFELGFLLLTINSNAEFSKQRRTAL